MVEKIKENKGNGRGRPRGTGKYGEPTQVVRVPISLVRKIRDMVKNAETVKKD